VREVKVLLNRSKCEGYGNCVFAAPGIIDLDDDGRAVLLVDELREERRGEVNEAVANCPARAIAVEG
jgi:ferredoxin